MMGHLEISGFEMHRGQICDYGFTAEMFSKFDLVYSGNDLVKMLFENAGYTVIVPNLINREAWQGASIRQAMKDGDDWEMDVPASVANIISEIELS